MLFVHDFGKTKKRRLLESKPPFFQNRRTAVTTSDDLRRHFKNIGPGWPFSGHSSMDCSAVVDRSG